MPNKHRGAGQDPAAGIPVRVEQLPTKPTKAYVAAVVTLLGFVGLHVTAGTAQAVLMVAWLALSWYGVWRARNRPKLPARGTSVQGFLQ